MNMPLEITVKHETWRMHDRSAEEGDRAFKVIRKLVIARSPDGRCAYCRFETKVDKLQGLSGFFELHHINNDHHDNDPANLTLICPFCHAYFHCGFAGIRKRAYLAAIPGISNAGLNYIMHMAHFMAASRKASMREAAQRIVSLTRAGERHLRETYELSNPIDLGDALLQALQAGDVAGEQKLRRDIRLLGIKLVPDITCEDYKTPIKFWNETASRRLGESLL